MQKIFSRIIAPGLLLAVAGTSLAGPCDAYFPFDGDLNDASGNGYHGLMIAKEGEPAAPAFVDGRVGRALHISGGNAMRAFLDLHFDQCPQVTITAWFQLLSVDSKGPQYLVSSGSGSGPGLRVSGGTLQMKATGNGIAQKNAVRDGRTWFFLAGVYDYTNKIYRLRWRNRTVPGKIGDKLYDMEDSLWVGTYNDKMSYTAEDLYIDDLRIYGEALTDDDLRRIMAGGPGGLSAPCASPDACGQRQLNAGAQQVTDPNFARAGSTRPAVQQGIDPNFARSGSTLPGIDANMARSGSSTPPIQQSMNEATRDAVAAARADSLPPDIGYASEEEALAAAERREREAYEAELARQQNELERQRREAAGQQTEDTQQALQPDASGGFSMGEQVFRSPVAGFSGKTSIPIDLVSEPIEFISVRRRNESILDGATKPIDVRIEGRSGRQIEALGIYDTQPKVRVGQPGGVFGALRACSFPANGRLTGLRIQGNLLDADGQWGQSFQESDEHNPYCTMWSEDVRCRDIDSVATGVVVHFKDATLNADKVSGVQLLCRKIIPN